jgi:L-asparaginase II
VPDSSAPARPAPRRTAARSSVPRAARYPRTAAPPVLVEVRRDGIVESRHRGHVVQVAADGRVERGVGDPDVLVTLRSAIKPFALVALIESGAADEFRLSGPELAVMAASHAGEDLHVRTLQAVMRRSGLSQSLLACGSEGMPLDASTAARLARDGEDPSPIRHMCSGFHTASLLLSRHAGWPLEGYDHPDHPSQVAVRGVIARVFGVDQAALRTATDACGLQTYAFPLVEVARAFALLADPLAAAPDPARVLLAPALGRVRDAMLGAPEQVGGTHEMTDTVVMKARPGLLVVKAGAEALRGVAILPGARGEGTPAAGMAVKIEDGDGAGRASRAVTIEALAQVGALDARALRLLARHHRPPAYDPRRRAVGESVPGFELAPISELL